MNGRLRVLHAVPYFPPDKIGGVGEVVCHLHQQLLARGYKSTVVTTGSSPDTKHVVRVCSRSQYFPIQSAKAFRLLRRHDVLHVHHGDSIGLLILGRLMRKPSLCTIHCSCAGVARSFRPYRIDDRVFGKDWRSLVQRWITNPIRHSVDLVSTSIATRTNFISKYGAQEFKRPIDDEHVIYNGIPDPTSMDLPTNEIDETDLLYVGTASHRKRVNALPIILREIQHRMDRAVTLRVIGFEPQSWPEMFKIADEVGVADSIVCEGRMTSKELQKFYGKSQVLLLPSAYEGLPLVIGEAQKAGLPCIATDVCAHSEVIIPEENGLLVPLDSVDEFAAAACRVLADGDLRRSMSRAAITKSRELFSLERQADLYCKLYHTLSTYFGHTPRPLADLEN